MKRFVALILATLMLLLAFVACNDENAESSSSETSGTTKPVVAQVPVYTGMTISYTKPSDEELNSQGITALARVDSYDPFGDGGKSLEELIDKEFSYEGSVTEGYYASQNSSVYILIHVDNPTGYKLSSFTLNGKEYINYGDNPNLLIYKYNTGDAQGVQEFNVENIKYLEVGELKDVTLEGEKTVKLNMIPSPQPRAGITLLSDFKTDTSLDAEIDVYDGSDIITKSEGEIFFVLYDGKSFSRKTALTLGENKLDLDGLKEDTVYQIAIVAAYDAGDGKGKIAHIMATRGFRTYELEKQSIHRQTNKYGEEEILGDHWYKNLDFDGETINILVRDDNKYLREFGLDDYGDNDLNEGIVQAAEATATALNIDVELCPLSGATTQEQWRAMFVDAVTNDVDEALHMYDIVAYPSYAAASLAVRDYHTNLLDKDVFPYFDFSLNCWNQSLFDNGTVNSQMFFCAGDLNLSMLDNAVVMWHNQTLYDSIKGAEDPEDIQNLVVSGKWTYAELFKWASYSDTQNTSDKCDDIYGLYMSDDAGVIDAISQAWMIEIIDTNSDGTHRFDWNGRSGTAPTSFKNLYSAQGNAYGKRGCTHGSHFAQAVELFCVDTLNPGGDNLAIREMEDTYALLPLPKLYQYDESYYTTSAEGYNLMSVIDHSRSTVPTKGEAVSAYMEYANEYSYTNIRMLYFNNVVRPRFFGAVNVSGHIEKQAVIFSTIVNNITFDFANIYNPLLNNFVSIFRRACTEDDSAIDIYMEDKQSYDNALENLDFWFGLIE